MRRTALALALSFLTLALTAAPGVASCATCLDSVSLQTPDGQPWSDGKPVTLVLTTHRTTTADLPASGVAVVMHTNGDRTKCLDVPLKLVQRSGDGGTYAGVFYPFRAAAYDGTLQLGDDTFDIRFDVRALAPTTSAAKANDLPIAAPDFADTALTVSSELGIAPLVLLSLAFWLGLAVFLGRRRASPRMA